MLGRTRGGIAVTIRQWMGRRVRWVTRGMFATIGACVVALLPNPPAAGLVFVVIPVAGVIVVVGWVAVNFFLFRCPRCRCNLAPLVANNPRCLWGIDPRLACCPYCALSLDEHTPEPEPANEHDRYPIDS